MNKIKLLLLALSVLFMACSDDDNDTGSNTDFFLEIEILGQKHNALSEQMVLNQSIPTEDCDSGNESALQFIGQVETSTMYVGTYIGHIEDESGFSSYNTNNSVLLTDVDTEDCYSNFDVIVDCFLDDGYLNLDSGKTQTSNITNVSKVEETSQMITYAVEGNFTAHFERANDSSVKVTGKYRGPIFVLK